MWRSLDYKIMGRGVCGNYRIAHPSHTALEYATLLFSSEERVPDGNFLSTQIFIL